MNSKLFALNNPKSFWLTAIAGSVIIGGLIVPFVDARPWLVVAAIVICSALVVRAELARPAHRSHEQNARGPLRESHPPVAKSA